MPDQPPPEPTEVDPYATVYKPQDTEQDPLATVAPAGTSSGRGEAGGEVRHVGNFELMGEIARGAMGVVYKARQANLNRTVALKMILSGQLAGADDVDRFRMEAAAAASLDHPGIVPIFEIGEHDGHHFFAMGFIDGPSLAARVAEGPLAPRDAARYAGQIAEAIQYAHDRGVIHRDLKPANILIDRDDRPKVTDFGLAKHFEGDSALTATGQVMGTPSYMPPEQASGDVRRVGPPADIYALGATLYCLLTGRPPFLAAGLLETLAQVIEKEPISPRKLNPDVAVDLETICLKCLEKDPSRRYGSAREVREELDRFLLGEPILARPIGPAARAWRWCGRNRAVASAAALAAALVLLVAVAGPVVAIRQAALRRGEAASRRSAEAARNAEADARRLAERASTDLAAEKNRALARNYASSVSLAHLETLNNNIAGAQQILSECPDLARGWEWNYVEGLANPARLVLCGHVGTVADARFSPDGRMLVSSGADGKLVLWDLVEGRRIRQHEPGLQRTLSPSGRLFADKVGQEVVIRDVVTGSTARRFASGDSDPIGRAFGPDDRYYAAAYGRAVVLIDLKREGQPRVLRASMPGGKVELALSAGGSRLAAGLEDGTILAWDLAGDGPPAVLRGHLRQVDGVSFAADGTTLVSASRDGTARLWDVGAARELKTLRGHLGWVAKAAFRSDGRFVATAGSDNSVRAWDVATGREVFQFRGNYRGVSNVAFSPDGTKLASAGADITVRVWDALRALPSADSIPDEMVRAFEATTGPAAREELHRNLAGHRTPDYVLGIGHTKPIQSVRFSPDGKSAATTGMDGTARIWDPETGRSLRVIEVGKASLLGQVAFSADGRSVAVSTGKGLEGLDTGKVILSDGEVKVYDPATGETRMTLEAPNGPVLALAAHPRRNLLAVASGCSANVLAGLGVRGVSPKMGEIRIWDLDRRSMIQSIPIGLGTAIALSFHPDGSEVVSVSDNFARAWEIDGGRLRLTINDRATDAAYSPDGRQIATAALDGSIKLWDSASGRLVRTLEGHSGVVFDLSFTPDGSRLASCSADKTVRIWDPASGLELLNLRGHSLEVLSVAFDPAGRRLASAGNDEVVEFWDSKTTPEDGSIDSWPPVFADDFRRDGLGDRWRVVHGGWTVKDGRLEGRISPRKVAGILAPVVSSRATLRGVKLPPTCEIRFDLRVASPIVCQVLFLDEAQALGETVDLAGAVNAFLGYKSSLIMVQLDEMGFAPFITNRAFQLEPGPTHDVRITREPDRLTVKVDGHTVLDGHQHAIEGATLSLAGIHGRAGDTIEFANLRIRAPQSAIDEQSARSTVDGLFAEVGLRDEVLARLRSDQDLGPTARERAIRLAEGRVEDADQLGLASMAVAMAPDRDPSAYALALRQAEAAHRLAPDQSARVLGLGAACFRVGDDRRGVELLARAREMELATDGHAGPAATAFLAMARARLGDREGARREFGRLRDLLRDRNWKDNEGARRLFGEAEARLGPLAAADAEAEAVKDVVLDAEQKGWLDGDLAAYMAARGDGYRGTSGRGPDAGPHDLAASGPSFETTHRLRLVEIPKEVRTWYDDVRCEVSGDRATVSCEVTVVIGTWLRAWASRFDLRRTPAGWKIVADRGWPIRAREGGQIIPLDAAYWAERDRRVEQARAAGDPRAVAAALLEATRPAEAWLVARSLTESPGATAADWATRGNAALAAFEPADAIESMKKALAIDPKQEVPPWAR